ncbi:uroporphyrinogen-III synthase [Marinobacterium rhizophilum]|uniref:Uroporphyrinogen-III synthase n=1 Tax=Marinobacterium rhizophilum TaxID=420402 RepID=A0ABY5HF63_9GAMM|nr:uroporphyrinogen-III synthase [Marinobacterium rhizophilum]UTW10996.1 uroporphyrinogen-III synthase [Marinobacterium rhizophilum]
MPTDTPSAPLGGRRILVTRPSHQARQQAELLRAQGADPVLLPLLDIASLSAADPQFQHSKQCVLDLDLYHAVIVVSANAARLGLDLIDDYWPQLPLGVHWMAIGASTAARLHDYGINARHSHDGYDSEALLRTPELQQVDGLRILILRGDSGRDALASELQNRGARVDQAILYRRARPELPPDTIESAIYAAPLSAILITSGESLSNLVALAQQFKGTDGLAQLQPCPLVVPSQRIAALATAAGFKQVILASGPDDQSMIGALLTKIDAEKD